MTLQIKGTNIAPKARCTQSSTCGWSVSADEAQRAVNGERNGAYSFHTNLEANPYLLLDFEKVVDFFVREGVLEIYKDFGIEIATITDKYRPEIYKMINEGNPSKSLVSLSSKFKKLIFD